MPLILGCLALVISISSLILGIYQYLQVGATSNTLFALILFVGGLLSAINLLRVYKKMSKKKKP